VNGQQWALQVGAEADGDHEQQRHDEEEGREGDRHQGAQKTLRRPVASPRRRGRRCPRGRRDPPATVTGRPFLVPHGVQASRWAAVRLGVKFVLSARSVVDRTPPQDRVADRLHDILVGAAVIEVVDQVRACLLTELAVEELERQMPGWGCPSGCSTTDQELPPPQ
jgi:hypothetical protein